jgi:hypothetical protein
MKDTISANFPELDRFMKAFAKNMSLARQKGIILDDFLTTVKYNRESVSHSRIWALIVKTGSDLDYVIEIAAGFAPTEGRQFYPDVQMWNSDQLEFLIEYESTNSSDSRVIYSDLQHYDKSKQDSSKTFPRYWLVLYTLPNKSVKDWSRWDYNKSDYAFDLMVQSPHKFYKRGFKDPAYLSEYGEPKQCPNIAEYPGITNYTESEDWNTHRIFFINLTDNGLEIDFPERFTKEYS